MDQNCRVCFSNEDGMHKLTEIANGATLLNILTDVSGMQIVLKENMPENICSACLSQVLSAAEIKHKVIEAENCLKAQINGETSIKVLDDDCLLQVSFIEDIKKHRSRKLLIPESCDALVDNELVQKASKRSRKKLKNNDSIPRYKERSELKNKTPNDMDYKCFICDQAFDKIATKNRHVRTDHAELTICKLCKVKCKTPLACETHVKFHFQDYGFMCEFCSKFFRYKNRLRTHMALHHEKAAEIMCDICGLTTKFKSNMKRHMKSVHLKMREFRCESCSDHQYTTQEALNSHLYRYHDVPAPIRCPDCSLGFTFVSELRAHKKYRFCSNNPNASFTKRLKGNYEHLEVVNQTGEHICKLCNEAFLTKSKFSMHNYLKHKHSNKCEQCNIVFTNYTSLIRHEKVKHQGQKPFKCEFCSKCFGQKVSLLSHRNTHTGNKTFGCAYCSFRSGDHGSVSKHKKKMHPEMMTITTKAHIQ